MIFLTTTDINQAIGEDQKNACLKGDTTKLEKSENYAIEMVKTILGGKYDCDYEFSRTGSARHNLLLEFTLSLACYHLMKNGLNPRNIPEIRKEDHDFAITQLNKWRDDKANPGIALLETEVKSNSVYLGGSKKTAFRW